MYIGKITNKASRILAALVLLGAQIVPYISVNMQKASAAPGDVRICHVDENVNDPYQSITVSPSSIDGVGNGDHYLSHTGPIATSSAVAQQLKDSHTSWGDIIPPVPGVHTGLNWTTTGQAIYNANCNISTIEVKKVLSPTNDTGLFNLRVEGTTYATNVGNNGTTSAIYVDDRTDITVSEMAGSSTTLNGYSTTLVCKNNNGNGATVTARNTNFTNTSSREGTIDSQDIHSGDKIVCIFTNTRLTGTLNVTKVLNQDNGGSKTPSDFSFVVSGYNNGNAIAFESDGSNSLQVPVGTYDITEVSAPGYTTTYQTCSAVSVTSSSTKTCTITNKANPAYLTVTKVVNNSNGGNAVPDDFGLSVNGKLVLSGQKKTYLAGTSLIVNESSVTGYDFVSITGDAACPKVLGGQLTLKPGDDISCVITNKDIAPVLTIVKNVINDNGGNLTANDFGIKINDTSVSFGAPVVNGSTSTYTYSKEVKSNTSYTMSEQDTTGYSEGSWSCTNDEIEIMFSISILLSEGKDATCTVTNNDIAPGLMLIKNVVNDFGGLTTADAWTLIAQHGTDTPVIEQQGMLAPNSDGAIAATPMTTVESGVFYKLSESNGPAGYEAGEWTCEGGEFVDGAIKLVFGTKVFCSITNTEVQPTLTVVKYATNDNGGEVEAKDFTLYVNNEALSDPVVTDEEGNVSSATYDVPLYTNTEYSVSEEEVSGYENLMISCVDVTNGTEDAPELSQPFKATSGMKVVCEIQNDDIPPSVHVTKHARGGCSNDEVYYEREWCSEDEFDFTLYVNEDTYSDFTLSDGEEYIAQKGMQSGVVEVEESEADGWFLVDAQCYTYGDDNMVTYLDTAFETSIGKEYYCDFYNEKSSQVIVTKFHDYDEDGEWDEGEPALPDWDMTLTPQHYCDKVSRVDTALRTINELVMNDCGSEEDNMMSSTTNDDGEALFDSLHSGRYVVDEVLQDGWIQSVIYCDENWNDELSRSSSIDENATSVYVYPGETVRCYVGNYRQPVVAIEKTNNTTGPVLRGSEITFTMVITVPAVATSGILHGTYDGSTYVPVTVNDGFTNEFQYITGSFTAQSIVRGDLKAAGIVTDPNYASPGTWNLTSASSNDVLPGEVITLSYRGIVEANAPAANYKTTATVTGYGDDITVTVSDTDDDQVVVYIPAVLGTSTTKKAVKKLASTGSEVTAGLVVGTSIALASWLVANRSKRQTVSAK